MQFDRLKRRQFITLLGGRSCPLSDAKQRMAIWACAGHFATFSGVKVGDGCQL
jgi:hypothetical protein